MHFVFNGIKSQAKQIIPQKMNVNVSKHKSSMNQPALRIKASAITDTLVKQTDAVVDEAHYKICVLFFSQIQVLSFV